MISVLFPAGGFGSTIEYCIRRFSKEFATIDATVADDGSMHTFCKIHHPLRMIEINEMLAADADIATITYPNLDKLPPSETLKIFKQLRVDMESVVFVAMPEIRQVLRNQLFVFNKILLNPAFVSKLFDNSTRFNQWNPQYTSVDDMERWEQREMLSLEFQDLSATCVAAELADDRWCTITPDELLTDFAQTIKKIITYLHLTLVNEGDLEEFASVWIKKQQYILDQYQLIENIVDHTINSASPCLMWEPLDLVNEALIQSMLRNQGFDLLCHGLNDFPLDSNSLRNHIISLA